MSDFDYGREHGLWGDDGIPYGIDKREYSSYDSPSKKSYKNTKSKKYNYSEQLAYDSGFRAVKDVSAYNGRYFIKNGKKWIHNIKALKYQLSISSESVLKDMGYDVHAYYLYKA